MAIEQQFCMNHPDRAAIGICVMTRKPICGECSTRYEGVNYSREGLELLHKERNALAAKRPGRGRALAVLVWALAPVMVYLVYAGFLTTVTLFMDLLRPVAQ